MAKNQIKIHWTDRLAGFFSPTAQRNRMIARQQTALLTRQYEAAHSFNSSQISRNSRSANRELRPAIALVRENVREIVRNTPFAQKGLQVIVNGTVGWGIEASITHQDKAKEQKIKELWADWSGGLCSVDGKTDFNTLQAQVMTAIVSDGEALLREIILEGSVRAMSAA